VGVAMLIDRARRRLLWFYVPVIGAIVAVTYSSRLHTGGWNNVRLPAYVAVAWLVGTGVGWARRHALDVVCALVLVLVAAQFVFLRYSVHDQLPKASNEAVGDRAVASLRDLPQPILMTGESWMLVRAGIQKSGTAHASALQDVMRTKPAVPEAAELTNELETAIQSHKYCTLILTRPPVFSALPKDYTQYYTKVGELLAPGQLNDTTGYNIRPVDIWEATSAPACGNR
jgi:hypothetical protein